MTRKIAIEIALVLVVKVTLLFILWKLFFSHPIAKTMDQIAISERLFLTNQQQTTQSKRI